MDEKQEFKRAHLLGLFIGNSIYSILFGLISGLIWSFSVGCLITNGLYYGSISGFIIGTILFISQKLATASGNLHPIEVRKLSWTIMGFLFLFSTILAIITALIRWLFF